MKKKLLRDILDFTKRQQEALAQEDIERFDRLTRRKQEFVEQLVKLQEEQPEEKDEEFKVLVQEIKDLDAANLTEFKRQMEEVKEELRKVREVKRGTNNYSNPYNQGFSSGQYFDTK